MELAIGAEAPKLRLDDAELGPREIPAVGGPQALFFFKVNCPTCPLAAPAVERLRLAYPALDVIAISQDEASQTRAWMLEHGLSSKTAAMEGELHPASAAFGLQAVPTLVLIDANGELRSVQEGWSRDGYDELSREAARLLGVKPVLIAPAEGPAFRPG